MSIVVDITVYRGTFNLKDAFDKPVRQTPDGFSGVVYGGAVYPLRTGNIINLEDEAYSKEDCGVFCESYDEVLYYNPVPSTSRWSTEFNNRANYVVFDGSEIIANDLFHFLESKGVANRLGESFRPAADGYHYDWFIRLNASCTEQLAQTLLLEFNFEEDPSLEEIGELEAAKNLAQLILLQEQVASLEQDLKVSKQSVDKLNSELINLRRMAERKDRELRAALIARDSHKSEAEKSALKLRKALARRTSSQDLKSKQAVNPDEHARDDMEVLEELAKEQDQLRSENIRLKAEVQNLNENQKSLQIQLDEITDALRREEESHQQTLEDMVIQSSAKLSNKGSKALKSFIAQIFEVFLPRIQLQQEDIQCLTQEIRKPQSTLKSLKQLNDNETAHKTKAVKGYAGLFEIEDINVGNPGKAGMGRIYYKNHQGKLEVGIHIKKDDREQARYLRTRFN